MMDQTILRSLRRVDDRLNIATVLSNHEPNPSARIVPRLYSALFRRHPMPTELNILPF
jgi:hypothetical protein